MLDLTDPQTVIQAAQVAGTDTDETVSVRLAQPDASAKKPMLSLARLFAFFVGGGLASLGVVALLASLTGHSTLLGLFHVDTPTSVIYLLSGVAGMAAWRLRRESAAVAYAVAMMLLYVLLFSAGNIAFGNAEGFPPAGATTFLGVLRLYDIPAIASNGMQITVAMLGLMTMVAAGLQQGARATLRTRSQQVVEYHSRTKVRTAA